MRYVYIIEARETGWQEGRWYERPLAYKIGSAATPTARVKELQVGSFAPLCIVAAFKCWDATAMERWLHGIWVTNRLRGEWFRPEQFIRDALVRLEKLFNEVPESAYQILGQNMIHDGWLYRYTHGREYVKPTWLMQQIVAA